MTGLLTSSSTGWSEGVKSETEMTIDNIIDIIKGVATTKSEHEEKEVTSIPELRIQIGIELEMHLRKLGYTPDNEGNAEIHAVHKSEIRKIQRIKRQEQILSQKRFILKNAKKLIHYVANGEEVDPKRIRPKLVEVQSGTREGDLFRFLSLYWSVPVSQGYGRRMRFLIMDENNGKAIGIFGLTDPVFNLRVRDNWIGWNLDQRKENLRSVMDAFVLGAIPPYSHLLGGKLVCTLLSSQEVRDVYEKKYANMKSVIRNRHHDNKLLLLTTTSALGKSSLYDRIKLDDRLFFKSVGFTEGYGHFHIPQDIFLKMRKLLEHLEHPYALRNRFGHGPNWKMRVIRVALKECGFNNQLLKHQIRRESFMIPLAKNTPACLRGDCDNPEYYEGDVQSISNQAIKRWMIPRAERKPEYQYVTQLDFLTQIVKLMVET